MATLKERIRALEAAAGPPQTTKSINNAGRSTLSSSATVGETNSPGHFEAAMKETLKLSDTSPSAVTAMSPSETALSSIPALRPVKSPSPRPSTPNRPSSSMRPPSLSVSQATPSPARPVATTNHSSPTAIPTTYAARKPPVLPPKLPARPSAPSSPAPSSLSANPQGNTGHQTGSKHGHTLSTSSWASVSLSSDGEAETSSSRNLATPRLPKNREHRGISAPPLPAREASVSSIASTSTVPATRRAPPVAPIANIPVPALPDRTTGPVTYNTYKPAVRERSRTLPPPLSPSPAVDAKDSKLPEPAYAVRRKAPQPPPLAPRPSQQDVDASKHAASHSKYNHIFDAVMVRQRDALSRGVVLEPTMQGTDSGWKRISAAESEEKMLASVVRAIWGRSRLDETLLRGIWKSVAGSISQVSLSKAQFSEGMAKIDQELLKQGR